MIYVITGKPGTGKTYCLTKLAWQAVINGRNVYTNFHIDFGKKITKLLLLRDKIKKIFFIFGIKINFSEVGRVRLWSNFDDLMDIKNGLILWDEAQIDLRSRDYKFLPREVEYKLQQHRKHGLDMFVASQNIKRIDIILRELANTIFELRRVGKIFIMRQFDLEDIDKATRKSIGVKLFRFDKSLGESFNTMEEIHKSKNPS